MINSIGSSKLQIFIEAYIRTWNASAAAREAGYKDYAKAGYKLLRKPEVQAAVEDAMKKAGMGKDEVLARLAHQARLNASDFFRFEDRPVLDEDGNPVVENGEPVSRRVMVGIDWAMVEEYGYLIKKIAYTRQGVPVLEFHDPQRALELVGKAHGLFVDRTELTGKDGGPVETKDVSDVISKLLPETPES